jgi:hypothetical protein
MNNRFLLLLLIFCIAFSQLNATHIIGGDMRYISLGYNANTQIGTYQMILKVYRDCHNGQPPFDDPAHVAVYAGDNLLTPITTNDLGLASESEIPFVNNDPCKLSPQGLCVEVGTYVMDLDLPYNASGYYFVYQRCCRNGIINNLKTPLDLGATIYAFMSGLAQQTENNSPIWGNYPPIMICLGQPLNYNISPTDLENDLINYTFCAPLLGGSKGIPRPNPPTAPPFLTPEYELGYSMQNPMRGNPQISINENSGLITGTPNHTGHFAMNVCARELRNGALLSEFSRNFEFVVSSCNQSILQIRLINTPCDEASENLNLFVANGTEPYTFLWNNGITAQNLTDISSDSTFSVTVTDAVGCTDDLIIRGNDCVWPGDANYDGVADNLDVLDIGLFYGENGPQRPFPTSSWYGQPAYFWDTYLANNVNMKHIDTDGSGSIDAFDVDYVSTNYSFTHPTAFRPENLNGIPLKLSIGTVDVDFSPLTVNVDIGTESEPVEGVYGISFKLSCDQPNIINFPDAVYPHLITSIFERGRDIIYLAKTDFTNTQVDFVICNTNHEPLPPIYGRIVNLVFYLKENLGSDTFHFTLSDVHLINEMGELMPVVIENTEFSTGIFDTQKITQGVRIVPNPAHNQANLFLDDAIFGDVSIEIHAADGRFIRSLKEIDVVDKKEIPLNVEGLEAGIYFIQVQTSEKVFVGKILIE